ncbi:MAG: DUF805 domain-containing protein [Gammaproteobacteria bacterium]|nr:DUF805 domain-containing protein [Gammaproteobacteria bacterium]
MTSTVIDNAGNIAEVANFAAPARAPTEAVRICLVKYLDFRGRASRSEFWWFWLFALVLPQSLSTAFGYLLSMDSHLQFYLDMAVFAPFFVPLMAAGMRRLHDIGRSGGLIVLLAAPWLLALAVPESVGVSGIVGLWGAVFWLTAVVVSFGLWVWWFVKPGDTKENAYNRPLLAEEVDRLAALPDGLTRAAHRRLNWAWYGGAVLVCGVAWALFGVVYVVPAWCAYLYWFSLAVCARFHVVKAVLPPRPMLSEREMDKTAFRAGGMAGFFFLFYLPARHAGYEPPLFNSDDGVSVVAWVCIIGLAAYMASQRGLLYFAFSTKHRLGNKPRIDLAPYIRRQSRRARMALPLIAFAALWAAQLSAVSIFDGLEMSFLNTLSAYVIVNGLGFVLLSVVAKGINHNHFT